jgi:hypothetical protein
VLALLVGAGIAWEATQDDSSPPTSTPLPVHEGYRWVGMNGVAVEVPDSWMTNVAICGPSALNIVVVDWRGGFACAGPGTGINPYASSLHIAKLSDARNFIAEMAPPDADHDVSIGALAAYRTDPIELNCPQPRPGDCTSVVGGSIEVPDADLLVWVESPHSTTVATILDSIRIIPDSQVAVPNVTGMAQSRAADRLGRLGLAPVTQCPRGGRVCDGGFIVRWTTPETGSVIATGTEVTMVVSSDVVLMN